MSYPRVQSWVTYAILPEHVTSALLLANSLRRSLTTRRIGCIVSSSLTNKDFATLSSSFDDIFFLKHNETKPFDYFQEECRVKIFAFTLEVFEKLAFLEPNSLILHNCDNLFSSVKSKVAPLNQEAKFERGCESVVPSDNFLITPCKPFANFLSEEFKQSSGEEKIVFRNFVLNNATKYGKDNGFYMQEKDEYVKLEQYVMQLSLETGELLKKDSWTPPFIVQLIGGNLEFSHLINHVKLLLAEGQLPLTEQAILAVWIKLVMEKTKPEPTPVFLKYCNEPIAIVGLSCRLPGANNIEEFWNMLYNGNAATRPPPQFRWRKDHVVTQVTKEERSIHAGFLASKVDEFDNKFFGISPKDAIFMDPQTRLLHEVMWESLESSGIDPTSLYGTHTGVYTGSWQNDYQNIVHNSSSNDFFRTYMGNGIGAGAARLSYLLGSTGPCIATECGCSSSILAVDLAVKSLRCGETNLALAGGVNLLLRPFTSKSMDYLFAPDGKCKTFDAKADGFGRAEGAGFLVLKRLSDALNDRDNIWALIRGSAVGQEGISKSLGTPTIQCEALAMNLAMENGGVCPEQVSYVETHGTGTAIGDPTEIAAIAQAYHSKYRKEPLIIGSVKTNVGHTESCSGITGIIKVVLSMQHELIPKHLNLDTLNPNINLESIPGKIPIQAIPWPKILGKPRLAGVSSFGITGTDGHVIIQEAPDITLPMVNLGLERPLHILKISAKTNDALEDLFKKHLEIFQHERKEDFRDVAFTANIGRAEFAQRAFIIASNNETAREKLVHSINIIKGNILEQTGKICFLFTGQGSQYPGMSRTLYASSPVFQFHFEECNRVLKEQHKLDIRKVLLENMDTTKLSRTIYSQTSIFVVEYCLLKLWQSWGLKPDFVLGHSLGEYCAAVASGFLSLADALKLVAEKSKLIDMLPQGSMLVVKADKANVKGIMEASKIQLDFAAVNTPEQTVLAGCTSCIRKLLQVCQKKYIEATILDATHAFHSQHMDPILDEYRKIADGINHGKGNGECSFISSIDGTEKEIVDAEYWVRHAREAVNFFSACQTLKNTGVRVYLEIGPQPILSAFVLRNLEGQNVCCLSSLRRGKNEWETMLSSLGKLWVAGFKVDWNEYDKPYERNKVNVLPFYPFQGQSFWVNPNEHAAPKIHPLVGYQFSNATNHNIFQNDVNVADLPYLKDHRIGSKIVFPGSGYAEIFLSVGYCVSNLLRNLTVKPKQPLAIEDVRIETPLELREDKSTRLQIIVKLSKSKQGDVERHAFQCKIFRRNLLETEIGNNEKWVVHARANFLPVVGQSKEILQTGLIRERIKDIMETNEPANMESFYKRIDAVGLTFGDSFKSIVRKWSEVQEEFNLNEVVAEVKVPAEIDKYLLHPLIIDAMFQVQILTMMTSNKTDVLMVPVKVGRVVLLGTLDKNEVKVYIHAKWKTKDNCRIWVCTEQLKPLAFMEQAELLETNVITIKSLLEIQYSQIPECWEETWKPISGLQDNRLVLGAYIENAVAQPDLFTKIRHSEMILSDDPQHSKMVNMLVTLYAYKALLLLGWTPKPGEIFSAKGLCLSLGIKTSYMEQLVYHYFNCFCDEFEMMAKNDVKNWTITSLKYPTVDRTEQEITILYDKLIKSDKMRPVTKIYANVAKHLPEFLTGEKNPLAILFPAETKHQQLSADYYYRVYPGMNECIQKLCVLLREYLSSVQSNPLNEDGKCMCRVLEVGAGTGLITRDVLEVFGQYFGNNFEYYYTDISQSFFGKAENRLKEYTNLKFTVFNIEENPLLQGIPVNYFDIVLASDVLHATRDLRECLANLRMALRPRGQFIFSETLIADKGITSVFGLLEGYWRFEDFDLRPHHACVSENVWHKLLIESGFEFVHFEKAYLGTLGVIAATATNLSGHKQWRNLERRSKVRSEGERRMRWVLFVAEGKDGISLGEVADVLSRAGCIVHVLYPRKEYEVEEDEETSEIYKVLGRKNEKLDGIIFGWGMEYRVRRQRKIALPFMHLAKWLLRQRSPPNLYVLTKRVNCISEEENNPGPATLFGMAKSLKNENSDLVIRVVDLGKAKLEPEVDQVLYELALSKQSREKERLQICYREEKRFEPKLKRVRLDPRSDLQLPPYTDRYQLRLPVTRRINDLVYVGLEELPLKEEEIEVRVFAYALNFRDIFSIIKPSAEFENINTVGLDYAGVVTRVGSRELNFGKGDRVFGVSLKIAQLPSYLVTNSDLVMKIPDGRTFAEMCTFPTVFSTSILCLLDVAKMTKNDTVLIHTGSGGVGLSAIQLAKSIGAKIITTAGSPRKRAYLNNLGIDHVFNSRDTSYKRDIMQVTNKRGVDIVLNSITGPEMLEASLDICARNARFVEMSKLGVWTDEKVKTRRKDVQYWIVDLASRGPKVWQTLQQRVLELLKNGQIDTIPFVRFDALRIRQAFNFFQSAMHIGKIVITMPEVKTEIGRWEVKLRLFDHESTYLITGGLGGIGFEVCKWMLGKGATNIVLTGRNPPKPQIQTEIDQINKEPSVTVTVMLADVGNAYQCKLLFDTLTQNGRFKTLRGIHHCAGVLKDNLYEIQNWSAFEATFNAKVEGTWNLHKLTIDLPLERFVLYSSMTALVGTPGQANHSAANCFEDAFAHYRYSLGLPATTINWGMWAQVGCAKDINFSGMLPVSVRRMLNGLEETTRNHILQVCYDDFDNLHSWTLFGPWFKNYLEERLAKSLDKSETQESLKITSQKFWQKVDAVEGELKKLEVVTYYLKAILRTTLRMGKDELILEDANLQDVGVDSLMMIEFRNSIQSLMGTRLSIPASLLKDCQTTKQIGKAILKNILNNEESRDGDEKLKDEVRIKDDFEQLLKCDCMLDEDIKPNDGKDYINAGRIKTVLVTGATGQLGPYVLVCLSKLKSVKEIICLIKTKEEGKPEKTLEKVLKSMYLMGKIDIKKISCEKGDILKVRFGLKTNVWEKLCREVDCVVHLASRSNHVEHYMNLHGRNQTDVRSTNVGGIRNVLKFAITTNTKSIFYASSIMAVYGGEKEDSLPDTWPEVDDWKSIGVAASTFGYATSKFVSELLLRKAQERGVPVKVFRLPWIMGETKTGMMNFESNHNLLRFIAYLKLKAMVATPFPAVFLPVDICADWSVKLFWNDDAPCGVYNIMHPLPQCELEFVKIAKEEFGTDIETVEWKNKHFVEKLYAPEMPLETMKELYQNIDRLIETTNRFTVTRGYFLYEERYFRNEKVRRYLPDMKNGLPSTMEVLTKSLKYAKRMGFFNKFGL